MKFKVFAAGWASGAPSADAILERYVAAPTKAFLSEDKRLARHLEVEITPEELMAMSTSQEFDILISGNGYIAFDDKGKGFKQR